uniref:Uncharacterized protein n=1 Tax=Chrysotila carterae TaxID=13221 RepID=A0A7S4BTM8_CHRCT
MPTHSSIHLHSANCARTHESWQPSPNASIMSVSVLSQRELACGFPLPLPPPAVTFLAFAAVSKASRRPHLHGEDGDRGSGGDGGDGDSGGGGGDGNSVGGGSDGEGARPEPKERQLAALK